MTRQLQLSFGLAVLMMLATTAMAGWGDNCQFTADRSGSAAMDGAELIEIHAQAGFLKITGDRGSDTVMASGTACAEHEDVLDDIDIKIRRSGNRVIVRTEFPDRYRGSARLDLTLTVPSTSHLRIQDGSGETSIEHVAAIDLEDGSGSIRIHDVDGDVTIVDGSGEMELEDIRGRVRLSDGSGEIEVRRVTGPVELEDGSGDVLIDTVSTDVLVNDDGSGDLTISNVDGSVRIGDDGSGDIRVAAVVGDVTVRNAGSGGVEVHDVSGTIDIPERW